MSVWEDGLLNDDIIGYGLVFLFALTIFLGITFAGVVITNIITVLMGGKKVKMREILPFALGAIALFRKLSSTKKIKRIENIFQIKPQMKPLTYDFVEVKADEVANTIRRMKKDGIGLYTPVAITDLDWIGQSSEADIKKALHLTNEMTVKQYMADCAAEYPEEYQLEKGEWPKSPSQIKPCANYGFSRLTSVEVRKLDRVRIYKIPTINSWEVPAYLGVGNWNACPDSEVHVMFLKYWKQKYDADIVAISRDSYDCWVGNPPVDRESAIELAREQYFLCNEVNNNLSENAEFLLSETYWFFWWD